MYFLINSFNMAESSQSGLVVRTVTVEHHRTQLRHKSSKDNSIVQASNTNDVPIPTPIIIVNNTIDNGTDKDMNGKKRKAVIGGWWCCPWYMVVGLLALIGLAIGLGVGLTGKKDTITTVSTVKLSNLDLKFTIVAGVEVNTTLITQLRCLVANITDKTKFSTILMTAWEESNGTSYFVDPQHPLNGASNCSLIDSSLNFRRRLQLDSNNQWIYPIDPVAVNISTVPPPGDVNYTFIDFLYDDTNIKKLATLQSIQEVSGATTRPIPPSQTPTPTPTSTSTSTGTPTSSNTPTCKYKGVIIYSYSLFDFLPFIFLIF